MSGDNRWQVSFMPLEIASLYCDWSVVYTPVSFLCKPGRSDPMRFSFAFVVYGFALAWITLAWPGLSRTCFRWQKTAAGEPQVGEFICRVAGHCSFANVGFAAGGFFGFWFCYGLLHWACDHGNPFGHLADRSASRYPYNPMALGRHYSVWRWQIQPCEGWRMGNI